MTADELQMDDDSRGAPLDGLRQQKSAAKWAITSEERSQMGDESRGVPPDER